MLRKIPSAMLRYPALAAKPEISFVICEGCKASGYQAWNGVAWKPGEKAVIRI